MTWEPVEGWWLDELAGDAGYEEDVTPMVLDLLEPAEGARYLDVGCGEGRMMRHLELLGAEPVGVDSVPAFLRRASAHGPVARYRLPGLRCFADGAFDGCVVSLVLEHLSDHVTFLAEMARVTRPGGVLALVLNHPFYTAPASAPIAEADGETTWRPGRYFSHGHTDEPVRDGTIRFHHRPIGDLLTTAALSGWDLRRLVEEGPSEGQIRRHPPLAAQRHFPRLLGGRWTRRSG